MSPLTGSNPGLVDFTRLQSGGTATSASAETPSPPAAQAGRLLQRSSQLAVFWSVTQLFPDAAGVGLKSTFGAVDISFSFSTEKFGFAL